ncbi:uncharacterized protein LOC127639384 isoform X2 [Xyrauchen texanus]|uniref:uncharacterized protein LOC127639384 isoform X2 n=1 Tax=Xyrauchen texanus TaxID=154827 RepID=UPI002241949B|nr:uncharacterized protein LOC127639384 isoform X2 [Xyrauchen texanus]
MLQHLIKLGILQLQLFLLIWCEAGETLTDKLTDLGENVTINCDFHEGEVYWLLLKLPEPVFILRTFSPNPFYYNKTISHKYSVKSKRHLYINNVTTNELGVYYCMKTEKTERHFSTGTRLHIIEPTPESQYHTTETTTKNTPQIQTPWHIITLISALLNCVLIIAVFGLIKVFGHGRKRTSERSKQETRLQHPRVTDLELPQDLIRTQCTEVGFSSPCNNSQSSHITSTYAFLQLPKTQTHEHD